MKFESPIPRLSDMERWGRNIPSFYPCTQTHLFTFVKIGSNVGMNLENIQGDIYSGTHSSAFDSLSVLTFPQSVSFKAAIQQRSCSGGDDSSLRWLAVGDDKGEEGEGWQKRETTYPLTRHCSQCLCPRWDLLIQLPFDIYSEDLKNFSMLVFSLSFLPSRKTVFK